MEEVNAYLTERRVPKGLRKQVRKQFDYFMDVRSAFDEDEILENMCELLRREVLLFVYRVRARNDVVILPPSSVQ